MTARIIHGDCVEEMRGLAAKSVHAIVTDPPYHLSSIVKRFGKPGSAAAKTGATGAYKRHSTGFMGKQWDGGDIAFQPETWRLCFDVLKPGSYLVAFGGARTYHRLVCAIEDAGQSGLAPHQQVADQCAEDDDQRHRGEREHEAVGDRVGHVGEDATVALEAEARMEDRAAGLAERGVDHHRRGQRAGDDDQVADPMGEQRA